MLLMSISLIACQNNVSTYFDVVLEYDKYYQSCNLEKLNGLYYFDIFETESYATAWMNHCEQFQNEYGVYERNQIGEPIEINEEFVTINYELKCNKKDCLNNGNQNIFFIKNNGVWKYFCEDNEIIGNCLNRYLEEKKDKFSEEIIHEFKQIDINSLNDEVRTHYPNLPDNNVNALVNDRIKKIKIEEVKQISNIECSEVCKDYKFLDSEEIIITDQGYNFNCYCTNYDDTIFLSLY